MRILLVAATCLEVQYLTESMNLIGGEDEPVTTYRWHDLEVDLVITGLGMTFTTYQLTKALQQKRYAMVMNVGIAGSFCDELSLGDVVNVVSEQISDLGIEEAGGFRTLFEVGFLGEDEFPFTRGQLINPYFQGKINLPSVRGLTGNTSHGRDESIEKVKNSFNPEIESMEGAAVFYVCLMEKIPFLEIRSISNYVESRDTTKWDIPLALENLTNELLRILRDFASIPQLS